MEADDYILLAAIRDGSEQAFNTLIANFPQLLVARPFGFAAQEYFQADTRVAGAIAAAD